MFTTTGRFTNNQNYNGGSGRGLFGVIGGLADESDSAKQQRAALNDAGLAASQFAEYNQGGVQQLDAESAALREAMRRRANGQDSLSAEQLRQGLQQQLAQQRSMAAGASPQNSAMAARTAMMGMNRAASGMAGNAAQAGIQERAAAEQALARMMMEQRGQSMQGAIGSRQNSISGYSGVKPEGSWLDKWGGAITGAAGAYANRGKK